MSDNSKILPDAAVSDDIDHEPEGSTEMESDVDVKAKDVRSKSTRLRASTLTQQIPEYVLNSVDKFQKHLDSCSDLELATADTVIKYIEALDDSVLEFQSLCTEYDVLIQENITQENETIKEMINYYEEEMPEIRKGLVSALNDHEETEEERQMKVAMEAAEEGLQAQLLQFREMKQRREAKKLMGATTPNSQTTRGQREITPTRSQLEITPSHAKHDRTWDNSQHRAIRPEVIDANNKQSQNSRESDSGINAMQALADCLMKTMKSTKRSALEPAVFSGDPIEFYEWEMDFDGFVDSEGLSEVEALRFLKKFVDGAARSCIAGQLITNSREAYTSARQQLRDRFGNKFNVARALRLKLDGWPKVQPSKGTQLREFSDYLNHLKMAMATITELHILNDSMENEKMVSKLPDYLISKWAEVIMNKRVQEQRYPSFHEFASFIHHQSEVLNEPIMALRHSSTEKIKESSYKTDTVKDKPIHARVLSTKTTTEISTCLYCNKVGQHHITTCWSFKKLPVEERLQFARSKRLCWSCAKLGHISKDCPDRSKCEDCGMRHPTILHNPDWKQSTSATDGNKATQTKSLSPGSTEDLPSNNSEKADTSSEKTADSSNEVTKPRAYKTRVSSQGLNMVLPVYVSVKSDPTKEILVYAILDTASCSSYISSDVAAHLKTQSTNEDIEMDTLNGTKALNVDNHLNLQVRGYTSKEYVDLEAFGVNSFSAEKDEIPTSVNVAHYEHLQSIAHNIPPLMEIPVGLLIGRNCSDVFIPYDCVKGKKGEPFAQKSILGWTVMAGAKKRRVTVNSCRIRYAPTSVRRTERSLINIKTPDTEGVQCDNRSGTQNQEKKSHNNTMTLSEEMSTQVIVSSRSQQSSVNFLIALLAIMALAQLHGPLGVSTTDTIQKVVRTDLGDTVHGHLDREWPQWTSTLDELCNPRQAKPAIIQIEKNVTDPNHFTDSRHVDISPCSQTDIKHISAPKKVSKGNRKSGYLKTCMDQEAAIRIVECEWLNESNTQQQNTEDKCKDWKDQGLFRIDQKQEIMEDTHQIDQTKEFIEDTHQKNDGLTLVKQRQTWKDKADNLKVDDVVLLMDQDQPRNDWRRGIVTETHPGEDGLVRKATVRYGNRFPDRKGNVTEKAIVLIRPVQKLVKLM